MNMQMMRKAIKMFKNKDVPKSVQRHNQRAWLRANSSIGEKHLLATPVTRKTDRDTFVLTKYRLAA